VLDWNILSVQNKLRLSLNKTSILVIPLSYLERGVRDDYYFRFGVGFYYSN
jgi:hypothetical protein